jgi:2,4-dienoyl-CoA reductase-like NADH-dependent reductase (Old Yellow Enzyme family)
MTMSLFQPIKIGKMELKNRIMRSATWDGTADRAGAVTDNSQKIYRELSTGGIGLIVTGFAFVSPMGKATTGQFGIDSDDLIPGWKSIIKDVHNNGGKIAMQIVHAGTNSGYLLAKGIALPAVSLVPELVGKADHEMTKEEIEGIISDFMAAGLRVREAGFDAVQLHGAHGFLMSQFASPIFNHRTDKWGGSPENRRRFHLEIIKRLRKALGPDYPILIKFGVQDDQKGGLTLAEGIETCRKMVAVGIDSIEVSAGIGQAIFKLHEGETLKTVFRERTAAVKRAVNVPIAVVNGIRSLETAQDILKTGDADIISMSRPFIREPHLALSWQKGEKPPAKCISCNKCFQVLQRDKMVGCGDEMGLNAEKK